MTADVTLAETQAELFAATAHNEILQESLADLELAMEDRGWSKIAFGAQQDFSRAGLNRIADTARVMLIANPLIRRAVMLRVVYVWGQGVHIAGRATGDDSGQDVNAVVQAFLDDESNKTAFTSGQAREEMEKALATDGNLFPAYFTNPLTGRVQVRRIPFAEVDDVITNPEDKWDPWFYKRVWTVEVVEAGYSGTRTRKETRRAYYPALGFRPRLRPRMVDGIPVQWDAPVDHVHVNRLDGQKFGIGDTYAALPWAKAYREFLEDWAKLVKALSRYAWRLSGDKSSKVRAAVDRMRAAVPVPAADGSGGPVGGTAAYGPGAHLEAIPKTGATIDAGSGRPLAAMVAAATGVPVTMLLGDPGVTGARAVAETLDKPTELEPGMRRDLWSDVHHRLFDYVIRQAVKAPQGPLRGTVRIDADGRERIELAGDVEATVDIDWPDLSEMDPAKLIEAIAAADATGKMPPLTTVRLLLQALGVKDVDELLEDMTDDDGRFVDPKVTAGQVAVDAFRRGDDPSSVF